MPSWEIDPRTLEMVVVDRPLLEAELACADPLDRLIPLALLGRLDAARAESARLGGSSLGDRYWRWLMIDAELSRWAGDLDAADLQHAAAWKVADSDPRRATVHQHVGKRRFPDALAVAARHFETARQLREACGGDDVGSSEMALAECRRRFDADAIVIAGGRGRRLGGTELGDKADVLAGERTLLEHALLTVSVATNVVVVGPERPTDRSVMWAQEDPPGAGPPAALAAGLDLVTSAFVLVTGVDSPGMAPAFDVLRAELAAAPTAAVAALLSDDGGPQPLAAMWRTERLRERVSAGLATLRAAFDSVEWIAVPDPQRWAADIDTQHDLRSHSPFRPAPDN